MPHKVPNYQLPDLNRRGKKKTLNNQHFAARILIIIFYGHLMCLYSVLKKLQRLCFQLFCTSMNTEGIIAFVWFMCRIAVCSYTGTKSFWVLFHKYYDFYLAQNKKFAQCVIPGNKKVLCKNSSSHSNFFVPAPDSRK